MRSRTDSEMQAFVTVVAWLLVVIGAFIGLESFLGFIVWTFFFPGEKLLVEMSLTSAVPLAFSVGAVLFGYGMTYRQEKALGRTVVLLWAVVLWLVVGFVWEVANLVSGPDHPPWSERFDLAMLISHFIYQIVVTIACAWLARRLSSPSIKQAYEV